MTLNIAEIAYESGELKFRYARRLSANGAGWIRDGLFQSFHKNGQLSSEGQYRDGLEEGLWSTYQQDGQLASRGSYREGKEIGGWAFWDLDENLEL